MGESASSKVSDDMSWGEVAQLGLRYGKIPLALLAVEALYWFITQPSDTLALIQVTEAYIWNEVTQLMFGEGASTLSAHNGWMTRIDFYHESFPYLDNRVGLYVSDECAGVHEMIFLSTLVLMTDGVTQREKFKAVAVMCGIVYVLNIVRLVAFYPIAVEDCLANVELPYFRLPVGFPHRVVVDVACLVQIHWWCIQYNESISRGQGTVANCHSQTLGAETRYLRRNHDSLFWNRMVLGQWKFSRNGCEECHRFLCIQ